ncbi:MAG: (2Fe-2S)-binding protein [Alphaproteobacteria bacterium]|nr:(2Fe-2S)-binding protein [Alphaproteobacteria bacterium]
MYVCLCNGFTDRCVRAAIDDGAGTVSQVFKTLGAAPQCGKCKDPIRALLDENDMASTDGALLASPA